MAGIVWFVCRIHLGTTTYLGKETGVAQALELSCRGLHLQVQRHLINLLQASGLGNGLLAKTDPAKPKIIHN